MTATLHPAPSHPIHQPVNTGAPDEPRTKCRTCRVEWPCIEYQRLAKARQEAGR